MIYNQNLIFIIYVLENCFYCNKAINIFKENNIKYNKIVIENNDENKNYYKEQNGINTFPHIFLRLDENRFKKIGGCSDLEEFIYENENVKI